MGVVQGWCGCDSEGVACTRMRGGEVRVRTTAMIRSLLSCNGSR